MEWTSGRVVLLADDLLPPLPMPARIGVPTRGFRKLAASCRLSFEELISDVGRFPRLERACPKPEAAGG